MQCKIFIVMMSMAMGLFVYCTEATAAYEPIYNERTGTLSLARVAVGADYYQVEMQYTGGMDFTITNSNYLGPVDGSGGGSYEFTAAYELPYVFNWDGRNAVLDGDNVIIAGAQSGSGSATYNGSTLFYDKAMVLSLGTGAITEYPLSSGDGHFGENMGAGRGNSTIIHRLGYGKFLVSGGYQYANTLDILDVERGTITSVNTVLNEIPFYVDLQAQTLLTNGIVGFFGYNDGLYGNAAIATVDPSTNQMTLLNSRLTMARSNISAYPLNDERILLVGGWDGSAAVSAGSATRRVEIYTPSTDTIVRVADFPEPISNGQEIVVPRKNDSQICVGGYTYTIANDGWTPGCDVPVAAEFVATINDTQCTVEELCHLSFDGTTYKSYFLLGKSSAGNLILLENGRYSTEFSDECDCYPVLTPSRIIVLMPWE